MSNNTTTKRNLFVGPIVVKTRTYPCRVTEYWIANPRNSKVSPGLVGFSDIDERKDWVLAWKPKVAKIVAEDLEIQNLG